ncbi:hypothetical protein BYT27DRAFT_7184590, partial [Phlegmacium glaucopus]
MLSFINTHISFYLTIFSFLLCIANLAGSTPISINSDFHRRHLQPVDPPFPYGRLADKILNVNHVSYMKRELDDCEEDSVDHLIPSTTAIPNQQEPLSDRFSQARYHQNSRWSGRMGHHSDFLAHDATVEH